MHPHILISITDGNQGLAGIFFRRIVAEGFSAGRAISEIFAERPPALGTAPLHPKRSPGPLVFLAAGPSRAALRRVATSPPISLFLSWGRGHEPTRRVG